MRRKIPYRREYATKRPSHPTAIPIKYTLFSAHYILFHQQANCGIPIALSHHCSRTKHRTIKKEDSVMPRGDSTGPAGMGSMSGRGAGYCSGSEKPGFASAPHVRGFGRSCGAWGRGFGGGGRRWRDMFYTGQSGRMRAAGFTGPSEHNASIRNPDPRTEKQALQNQVSALQSQLETLTKRLSAIETGHAGA